MFDLPMQRLPLNSEIGAGRSVMGSSCLRVGFLVLRGPAPDFKARGKRSTIVTTQATRTAKRSSFLSSYYFDALIFALFSRLSLSIDSFFRATPLCKHSFLLMVFGMSYFHRNLLDEFRAMIIFRPRKNKFLPSLLSAHSLWSRYYSSAKKLSIFNF